MRRPLLRRRPRTRPSTSTTSSRFWMGWTAASNYVLDYFFFLPTFSPAASKSDKSSSFFCVGIQSGESRRRRAGVESKTPESYLLDLLLRRGLGHGDAGGLGRVRVEALEVREAFLGLFDELVVLRDLCANQPVCRVFAVAGRAATI